MKIADVLVDWEERTLYSECTWHQLSPYIGRMKSSMARSLVSQFSQPGDTVYDPFSGAGTESVLREDTKPIMWYDQAVTRLGKET